MPSLGEIAAAIMKAKQGAQDSIRKQYLSELATYTHRDTIVYASAFSSKKLPQIPSYLISIALDDIQGFMAVLNGLTGDNLDLIIHSPGGSLEAVDQIVQYLRAKYAHIRGIIPQNAMSAASMLACACDEIVMAKHSAIGPIDPQITFPTMNGHFTAPAQAILNEFDRAKEEIIADPRTAPLWAAKIQSYPQGFLDICERTIELSQNKVMEWLNQYMFREIPPESKPGQAIAEWLAKADEHKTHGRPIGIALAREKGLKVTALEDDPELQERVLSYFHAMCVTFDISDFMKIIENHLGKGKYVIAQIQLVQK
jgi:hypothetical protein